MLHSRDGVRWVMICARFPPDVTLCIQAKEFNFHLIRPQNLLPHAISPLRAILQSPGVLSCAFFSGVAFVWPLSYKAEICEVLQRLLSFWQVLPSQPRNCVVLSEWSLGSWSPPSPRSFLLSLDRRPALGRVWVVPYSFHILMIELTMCLEAFNTL